MKNALFGLGIMAAVALVSYQTGYKRAQTHYKLEATLAAQVVKEAVSRASDALSALTQSVSTADGRDDAQLKEIEDAALADGSVCLIPVERLRSLDAITD